MLIFDQLKRNDPQLRLLTLAVLAGMLVLLAGLWWVQIVSVRDYQAHLETQSLRTVRIPAPRGKITDRNGVVLAENRPSYSISLYLEDLSESYQKEFKRIRPTRVVTNALPFWKRWLGSPSVTTEYVPLKSEPLEKLKRQARYNATSNAVQQIARTMNRPLQLDAKDFQKQYERRALPFPIMKVSNPAEIVRFQEQLPGVIPADLEIESVRVYPSNTTAAHVLGQLHRNNDRSFEGEDAYFDYRLPDYSGIDGTGIEYALDEELRGLAGTKSVQVNNFGYRQTENTWTAVQPGHNVVLTLDIHIQQAAEKALRDAAVEGPPRGAAVVMDVRTGDVLALASVPTFDPNMFTHDFSPADYERMTALGGEKNRATQENYRPGSIFKPVVGLACLENGLDPNVEIEVTPDPRRLYASAINVKGRWIGDTAPPGKYNFERALIHSSNSYFITNGLRYGFENVARLCHRLHLGESTGLATRQQLPDSWPGVGIRQETKGNFPSDRRIHSGWSDGDSANILFGQGEIDVTPLQMTVVAAALANGGTVLWPRLVDRVEPQDPVSNESPIIFPKGRVRDTLGVSQRSMKILQDAMLADVEIPGGTAYKAFHGQGVPPLNLHVCSKTGTAQNERNGKVDKTIATTWFLAFAPYENPRYAVVVMIESGASGGDTCAPIGRKIFEAIVQSEKAPPLKTGTLAQSQ
jgi:penicillin-binding protein 2